MLLIQFLEFTLISTGYYCARSVTKDIKPLPWCKEILLLSASVYSFNFIITQIFLTRVEIKYTELYLKNSSVSVKH